MVFIPCEKAPRIAMGSIVAPRDGYIVRPARLAKNVRKQVEDIAPLLMRCKLRNEQSVYSDNGGALAALRADVLRGTNQTDLNGIIERIMDTRPYLTPDVERQFPRRHRNSHDFRFDDNFLAPDEPPTAGLLLSQERRKVYDNITKSFFFTISQVMESYMLAAAIMRAEPFNLPVYPATAIVPSGSEGEEEHTPLLAIVDASAPEPLTTFNLFRKHPLMGSLEIISDEAMWGVSNTMRAVNRVKYLVAEMSMAIMEGREYPAADMQERLREIASSLHACHRIWPGSHFVTDALTILEESVKRPLADDTIRMIEGDWEVFSDMFPILVANGSLLEAHVIATSSEAAEGLADRTRAFLAELISKDVSPSQRLAN